MDFALSGDQRKRYNGIITGVNEMCDIYGQPESPSYYSRSQWKAAAALGLTGLCLPNAQGGSGLGVLDTALCMEAFGRACPDTGLVFGIAAHLFACGVPVRDFASAEVRDQILPGMASGNLIGANAVTEQGAGSDLSAQNMMADRHDSYYVLNGEKTFSTNAPVADFFVTYAVTNKQAGFLGYTAFVVPRDFPGVEIGKPFAKMGLHSCPASAVRFNQCKVPDSYRLGEEGTGNTVFQRAMDWERTCLFAGYVGLMDTQSERCISHARNRRQFGHPISRFQAISHRIAIMKQRIEAARLLLYRACWLMDTEQDASLAISLAKVAVSESSVANSLDSVQIFGGDGYLSAGGIEQYLRDSVPTTIFSGTTEIQREIIAKELGL